jgi:hypothetical protein
MILEFQRFRHRKILGTIWNEGAFARRMIVMTVDMLFNIIKHIISVGIVRFFYLSFPLAEPSSEP